jgi:hypothetical protein
MSHAALIALMHNQSLSTEMFETFTTIAEEVTKNSIIILSELNRMLLEFLQYAAYKYTATFGNNHELAFLLFFIVLYVGFQISRVKNYADRLKEAEDQIQYLKKKTKIQQGNMEYIFDQKANNELKLIKLTKQMKKLQKEVAEYA